MKPKKKQAYLRRIAEYFGFTIGENEGPEHRVGADSPYADSENRLQHVIGGANLGYWDWDYRTDRQEVNGRWLEILGLDRTDIDNHVNDCIGRMHPEDREKMLALAQQVFVNVSGGGARLCAFYDLFQEVFRSHNLQSGDIGIELTENTLIKGGDSDVEILNKLRNAGVQIALDDFGTGYSSLSYVKRFPIDILKIDQSFVREAPSTQGDESIIRAIVAMATSLGLRVIAEGVETESQSRFVKQAGCGIAQGYFFHAPLYAHEINQAHMVHVFE